MPTVSVVIPTYKHRDFVLATLDSVFAQMFTDYEVIVVNDGSPDDTARVLKPLADAGRIRYIEQENQGQAAARNRGLVEAQGEFVAFLDDDDLWPPDTLEWQVQRLRSDVGLGMVAGAMQVLDTGKPPAFPEPSPVIAQFEQLFYGCPLTSPGQALIRTDVLKSVGGFDATIWGADDYDLWFRLARVTQVELWQWVSLYYRKHSLNASHDLPRMYQNSEIVLNRHLNLLPARRQSLSSRVAMRYLYQYIGKPILLQARTSVIKGRFLDALRTASILRGLLRPIVLDPKLALMVSRDFIFTPLAEGKSR